LTTLVNFNGGAAGAGPEFRESLVQGLNGDLYGTTSGGGDFSGGCYALGGCGAVFKVTTGGGLGALVEFDQTDGNSPGAGLLLTASGAYYGTTLGGGANGYGTVFKITASGMLTTLYSFCSVGGTSCTDGSLPAAALAQAGNGDFYGTTTSGGANGYGTVFKITSGGAMTVLYNFCSVGAAACTDGASPLDGLVLASNGDLYGTTSSYGANGPSYGTVFKITPSGTLTTIHSFGGADGSTPYGGLIQATNGNLYGTTVSGGAYGYGTVFKITTAGKLTTLHSFDFTDGLYPSARLTQATDGNFYGTTTGSFTSCTSGSPLCGTLFKVTPSGTLTTLYSFCPQQNSQGVCPDGDAPWSGLAQATNGTLYGTTFAGGTPNHGTVFSLSVGLAPFVETLPATGKVGAAVEILGTDLKGATSVTFNGVVASFNVVSASEITTTVPVGATTGKVQVSTPGGTLTSNVNFKVSP
jgi:uncharacterized repeat protein (TIGR03803 family)